MKNKWHGLFGLLFLLSVFAEVQAETYKLYYLGGQSNMVGFGYNNKLPDHLRNQEDAYIYKGKSAADDDLSGGQGEWIPVQPGLGLLIITEQANNSVETGENSATQLSDRFGPELSFAHQIRKLHPDEKIAIIKYARGGTALVDGVSAYGSWDPHVRKPNQYNHFMAIINDALARSDIDGDGREDVLEPAGIVWMQGEADAFDNQNASDNYLANLTGLMGRIRAAFRSPNLPVVIGKITDSKLNESVQVMKYSKQVRIAQEAFAELDACAAISRATEDNSYPSDDEWHYDTDGYIRMGIDFAHQLSSLRHCL